jgi:transcriptional regulator of arginine metabolism
MQKQKRHNKIKEIIATRRIAKQSELAALLRKEGFRVTQASISRDLPEIGVKKINGVYAVEPDTPIVGNFGVYSVAPAGDNLIVIKCGIGLAPAAALLIDKIRLDGIAGTIAGDDTIFVATNKRKSGAKIAAKIREVFENGK